MSLHNNSYFYIFISVNSIIIFLPYRHSATDLCGRTATDLTNAYR